MKKLISILSAMVVLLSMTACGKNGDASKSITTTTTSITTTQSENEQPEIESLPVPEGGWTAEELAKTIRINGELISLPFTIDSLGEGYTYSEEHYSIEYNGDYLAMVTFVDGEEGEEKHKAVKSLGASINTTTENITINGISLKSKRSDALKAFGKPTTETDKSDLYYEEGKENCYLALVYDENDNVSMITFHFI